VSCNNENVAISSDSTVTQVYEGNFAATTVAQNGPKFLGSANEFEHIAQTASIDRKIFATERCEHDCSLNFPVAKIFLSFTAN
jgi:hypothetical protein